MKPFFPDKNSYTSDDKKVELTVYKKDWSAVLIDKTTAKKYRWKKDSVHYPASAIFATNRQLVILLGGLGDPGMSLGLVRIFSYSGKVEKEIDLQRTIPDLEKLSKEFREDLGPFPWIGKTTLIDSTLEIEVCKKLKVEIDLVTFNVMVR